MKLNFFIICAAIATTADAQRVTVTRTVTISKPFTVTQINTKTVTVSTPFTVTQTKSLSITVSQCPTTTTNPPPTTTTSTIPPRPTDETRCGANLGQVHGWCPEGQRCSYSTPFYCENAPSVCGSSDRGWCSNQQVCVCDYDWSAKPPMQCRCVDPNPLQCGGELFGECRDKTKPKCLAQNCVYGYGGSYCEYACAA